MKKTMSILLATAFAATTGLTAFADTLPGEEGAYTTKQNPGATVEIPLNLEEDMDLDDLRIYNKLTSGKSAVESIELDRGENGEDSLILKLKSTYGVDTDEIEGEIQLKKRTSGSLVKSFEMDFDVNWDKAQLSEDAELTETVDNSTPVYEFHSSNKNVTFSFDGVDANFEVRLEDQDAVNMYFSTKADKEITQANEDADLSFLSFEGKPEFDFRGTLNYYVEDTDKDWYMYEIDSKGKLKTSAAKYDEDEGAFVLKTSTLGSYVVSDMKLKNADKAPADNGDKDDDKNESGKPENPNTGANDFVGAAVALGAVSLVAAGAVAAKKHSK
ncbi:MAG: hypothetical protein MR014_09950 [Oscillospiraceae bacterium]|nr:hypothetical protein [Oscillospiraceae bacterium]